MAKVLIFKLNINLPQLPKTSPFLKRFLLPIFTAPKHFAHE